MGRLVGSFGRPLPYEWYANLQACPPSIGVDEGRSKSVHTEASMSDVIAFSFENNKVRTLGTPETPLFIAADVCAALKHSVTLFATTSTPKIKSRSKSKPMAGARRSTPSMSLVSTP